MTVMLTAALRYAELGYRVFPCAPGSKVPLTEHGFHDATTDPEQIERWWTQYPSANIGIPTEGLLVIDIDGNGNNWPPDPECSATLAHAGAMSLTPRGGRHYIFRQPVGKHWRCTEGRLAPKVDTRADGGYIVVPPAVIDGKSYRWAPSLELNDPPDCLPEPPSWLIAELDRLSAPISQVANSNDGNLIPEGRRNKTLFRLGCAMRRVGMTQAEIAAALFQINKDRCVPPLSPQEVERVANSAARYEPDAIAVALVEDHFSQMYSEENDGDNESIVEAVDPGPIPDELLRVPGFIGEVMQYTLDTAPYPEPVLAFAGALTLQALLAGRKVRDTMDNRTNLYVISLANSGVGKDHARKVNARILYEVGLADCLGTSFASGEGIEDRLFVQPATLFQVDEIDGLLLRVSQAKDARHEQIISILLQMYSAASTIYVMRAKAGRDRMVIDQPCLCLFGTAVPKHFYESLSTRLMTNGFLARLLILECRRRGTGRDNTEQPIPASILETARWWADYRPGAAGNLAEWHPDPYLVPQTADAEIAFQTIRERADAEYSRYEQANDPAGMAIWARAYEKARRLALIYAVSACRDRPIITHDAAIWAGAFVEHQTRRMLYMAARHTSESDFDSKRKLLLEVLEQWKRKHGDAWMPYWKIARKLPWPKQTHDEVRDILLEQRLIETQVAKIGKRGRPGLNYRIAGK